MLHHETLADKRTSLLWTYMRAIMLQCTYFSHTHRNNCIPVEVSVSSRDIKAQRSLMQSKCCFYLSLAQPFIVFYSHFCCWMPVDFRHPIHYYHVAYRVVICVMTKHFCCTTNMQLSKFYMLQKLSIFLIGNSSTVVFS